MDSTIAVSVRNVYGKDKYYPGNDQARVLADIAGTKTLTLATMRKAVAMGFAIKRIEANPTDRVPPFIGKDWRLDDLIAN